MRDTKSSSFSVGWTVVTGPDRSHLIDVRVFDRLRDARAEFDSLAPKPRQIWRHTWEHPFTTAGSRRLIADATKAPPCVNNSNRTCSPQPKPSWRTWARPPKARPSTPLGCAGRQVRQSSRDQPDGGTALQADCREIGLAGRKGYAGPASQCAILVESKLVGREVQFNGNHIARCIRV